MTIYFKATGLAQRSFIALDWNSKPKREIISGLSMRGYGYELTKNKRRVYNIIVSADQIQNQTDVDFFETFFLSPGKSISFDGADWVDVMFESGDYPGDYIEGIKNLHEVNMNLVRVNPNPARATGETHY